MSSSTMDQPGITATGATTGAVAMPYLNGALPVGLVGASVVAVLFLVLDTLAGHPLGTPNALGATLFLGQPFDPAAPIQPSAVFAFTLLHGAMFIVVATAAVSAEFTLARAGVSLPVQLALGVTGLAVSLQAIFGMISLLLDLSWVGGLGFERILVANVVAAFGMAVTVYLCGEGRRMSAARERRAE